METEELYDKLFNLREKLRRKFQANGRIPTICSDESLREIATRAPRQKDDLLGIGGIGETFVEKYGDFFMVYLNQYHRSHVKLTQLKKDVKNTLKNLENRLVNISKKNRLLYMGKIHNKYAYDMFCDNDEFNDSVAGLLMGKIAKLNITSATDDQAEKEKRFKKVLPLIREVNKELRESGQYDLYIGYPFVMGKTRGEDFNVRAPLMLFPVTYERKDQDIILKLDKTKDVMYNSNLVLMQNKFLNKNNELPDHIIEDLKTETIIDDMKKFYEDNGITLNITDSSYINQKLNDIKADEFPKFRPGEFQVLSSAVLGKFSLYSTALQKDFKKIIEDEEINMPLNELISNMDSVNVYEEELNEEAYEEEQYINFKEGDISYINDLNASQEQVIMAVDKNDKLVVQGPPGTGKSQTITSLIADAVNKGNNVLMVSQKKAALDVIYSRLGNLSKFAIMLNDVKDKVSFYTQLNNLFNSDKLFNYERLEYEKLSSNIDTNIKNLEVIANKLYTYRTNGVGIYQIYQDSSNNTFKTEQPFENMFYATVNQKLLSINYNELKEIKEKFDNIELLQSGIDYTIAQENYKWLEDIKKNLSVFDLNKMQSDFTSFAGEQLEFLKLGFFKRLSKKGERKKGLKQLYKTYFKKKGSFKEIFNNPQKLIDGIKLYDDYQNAKLVSESFTENEKLYISSLTKIYTQESELAKNDYLFDFVTICMIRQFENQNRDVFMAISNFNYIRDQIIANINTKKEYTKERLKSVVVNAYRKELLRSKRYYEISRQIESTRKWDITKFLKKFDFELFKGIKIWLMTPESVSEVLPLEKGMFDLLVFDEASQIYIERGVPAISRAKKVVIAGDHKQLRPSSLGFGRLGYEEDEISDEELETNAALEEESLLDLARFRYPSVMLNYHYRSKYEELINFSNYAFYKGRLNVSPNIEKPDAPPIEFIKIDNGRWVNRCNKAEAIKVVETVKNFLKNRKKNETLGVITFNTNQRDAILDELDAECLRDKAFSTIYKKEFDRKEDGEDKGLFVKNIENVQGDERDCIIFSIGYAKNEEGKIVRNFGWLNQQGGENRLNVAISRAKRKIYVVSSLAPNELVTDDLKNEGPKLFRKYLDYCMAVSNDNPYEVAMILASIGTKQEEIVEDIVSTDFEEDVYNSLTEKGLIVDKQVGAGGYKIDFAIKNKEGKYLLGIECDGKLYSSKMKIRERDIYRQQYLEIRGWKIYRLWTTNWFKNKDKEIEKILKLLSQEK